MTWMIQWDNAAGAGNPNAASVSESRTSPFRHSHSSTYAFEFAPDDAYNIANACANGDATVCGYAGDAGAGDGAPVRNGAGIAPPGPRATVVVASRPSAVDSGAAVSRSTPGGLVRPSRPRHVPAPPYPPDHERHPQ